MSEADDSKPGAQSGAPASVPDASASQQDVASHDAAPPRGVRAAAVVRWLIVAAMAAAACAAIAYTMGWWQPIASEDAGPERHVCPMHPSVVQDAPGQCPICSMDLVPARELGSSASAPGQSAAADAPAEAASDVPGLAAVDLTPERIQLAGLRTAPVRRATLAPELRATGTVSASETGFAQVQTRVAGWIEELHVEQTGERIKKGQLLARIYSPEWLTAQQEFLTALRWNGTAPAEATPTSVAEGSTAAPKPGFAEGARRRLELLGVIPAEIDEIARGGVPLRALGVRSPVAGHVTRKNVVQGQYVQPGTPLFEVADLSKVWVLADVPEHELGRVAVGAGARVELNAFADRRLQGRVDFVYPTVAADTRSVRLRVELDNADFALKPGMYGDVYIAASATDALVVPSEAVVDTGAVQYVFIARAGGRFEPRRVRVGATEGENVQLLAGVAEGDIVVTTANFLVDSESRLQAAIMGGAPDVPAEAAPPAPVAPVPPAPVAPAPVAPAPVAPAPSAPPVAPAPSAPPVAPAPAAAPPPRPASVCDREFDRAKHPDKYRQCIACEIQHRGMGPAMIDECKHAIPRPWR